MKLKRKITQSELDALAEHLKGLYVKQGDSYILDVEDTAFEELKTEKKALADELKEYKDKEAERIREAEERAEKRAKEKYEKAKTDKDVEAIEKSWSEKYDKLEEQHKSLETKHNDYVTKSLIDNVVNTMANEISTSPTLIAPHIRSRLSVDLTSDTPKIIVLDTDGNRSALTVDELKKSFIDNKDFGAIIKATSASGGAKAGGFMSGTPSGEKPKRLSEMSDYELAQMAKEQFNSEE